MLVKKKRISDEIVTKSNGLERKMAIDPALGAIELAHHLGAREAFLSIYKFIGSKDPQSDEVAIEDIDAFCSAAFRKEADIAYSVELGVDFPYNKKIALGKVWAYKNVQAELDLLKAELDTDDEQA